MIPPKGFNQHVSRFCFTLVTLPVSVLNNCVTPHSFLGTITVMKYQKISDINDFRKKIF
jgi:hypothetical protein